MSKVEGLLERYPDKKFPNLMLALILKYVDAVEVKELTKDERRALEDKRKNIAASLKEKFKSGPVKEEILQSLNKHVKNDQHLKTELKDALRKQGYKIPDKPKKEVPDNVPDLDEL